MHFIKTLVCLFLAILIEVILAEYVYPDGGRNVIPVIKHKHFRPQPYNDGTVMAHVIGSAGMNFLYYFHILGVSCENTDPEFYKIIQKDFEFCLNKTGPLPPQLRREPLGSIPKPCVEWKLRRPCYKNLADDYDECLVNKPGLIKKGTDALRFTHAYAKFICGNMVDTEAHLTDRYTKHNLVVNGVFQCFPHLQDRIVNCIKKDKVSKTLCSKFFIVHACFGKYYNDDNCQDVQPIYYMDELFRNMSTSLSCPARDEHWYPTGPPPPPPSNGPSHRPPTNGWSSTPPTKGWTSREEFSHKENPWPGEQGRPWSLERDREPFIKEDRQQYPSPYQSHRPPVYPSRGPSRDRGRDWSSSSSSSSNDRGRDRFVNTDTHSNRPYPDVHWSHSQGRTRDRGHRPPWVNVMDKGRTGMGRPWSPRKDQIVQTSDREQELNKFIPVRGGSTSMERERDRYNDNQRFYFSSSSTPRSGRIRQELPAAQFAVTRSSQDMTEDEEEEQDRVHDYDDNRKYSRTRQGSSSSKDNDEEEEEEDRRYKSYTFE